MTTRGAAVSAAAAMSVAAYAASAVLATRHQDGWAALTCATGGLIAVLTMAALLFSARPQRHRNHP